MNKILLGLFCVVLVGIVCLTVYQVEKLNTGSFGAVGSDGGYVRDTITGATFASTTINTTSTQVFSAITRFGTIINNTSTEIYCLVDAPGTTAVSSTVTSTLGFVIPRALTTTTTIPTQITFGECWPGAYNCVPLKGAVNCLALTASVVNKVSK